MADVSFLSPIQRFFFEKPVAVKEDDQNSYIFLSVCGFFGFSMHTIFFFLFWAIDVKPLAFFNVLSLILWIVSIYLNRKGRHLSAISLGLLEVYSHQSMCVYFIGWATGFQYYILTFPVAIYLLSHGHNFKKVILCFIGFLNYVLLDYFLKHEEPVFLLDPLLIMIFNYSNLLGFVLIIAFGCYYFSAQILTAKIALKKEQQKVKKAYDLVSKYVPAQLINTISNGRIESMSDHQRIKLTIFFSDIKNFTSMTDGMEPEVMAGLLNEYLSEMDKIVNKYNGTLSQIIGDALVVFFGAPEQTTDKDQALRCLNMAIEMQNKIKELQKEWFNKGIDEDFMIRCGINTGMATVGSFGSSTRKLYTAYGMQVNLAARLEQACEPGSILISHSTWALVKDEVSSAEKSQINAKGYHKPVRAYEVEFN